jgi:hypothetical protein
MMVPDHVGDHEAIVYAQLGQQPLARTTETSLELNPGTFSCLSARPPDLAAVRQEHGPRCGGDRGVIEQSPISTLQL